VLAGQTGVMSETQPRAMADAAAREALRARLQEPHIAPITAFVDRLQARHAERIPYVDPNTGGVKARLLFVLKRPGPRAVESGFLSISNHDLTAKYMLELLGEAGIPYSEIMVWNIVPWFAPREQTMTREEIAAGAGYLNDLLTLLPHLRSVVLVGREAQSADQLLRLPPAVRVLKARHTSPSNLHTNPEQRAKILRAYDAAWAHATRVSLDKQQVELVGRAWLEARLTREGVEVARPARDRGIDLVVFHDIADQPFRAVPIQMKASTERVFSINRKYIGRGIVMAYVWHVLRPEPRLFLVPHDEAIKLLSEKTLATASWTEDGAWTTTRPSAELEAALARYENLEALYGA
jgi:uracil-DNA glycosylase